MMRMAVHDISGAEVIRLSGEVDLFERDRLASTIAECISRSDLTILDTTDLVFMDSSIAALIADSYGVARAAGRYLMVCLPPWASSTIRKLLLELLPEQTRNMSVVPSVEAARRRFDRMSKVGLLDRVGEARAELWRQLHRHESLVADLESHLLAQVALRSQRPARTGDASL